MGRWKCSRRAAKEEAKGGRRAGQASSKGVSSRDRCCSEKSVGKIARSGSVKSVEKVLNGHCALKSRINKLYFRRMVLYTHKASAYKN